MNRKSSKLLSLILSLGIIISIMAILPTVVQGENPWLTMIDWEKDSEGNDPTITNLVVLGGNKSTALKTLESYKATGTNATNPYKEDSKQGLSIYNDKTNPVCNPTAKSEPTSVSLDAEKMKDAKDLRVSMHIKEKVNYTEQFNIGVTVDGKVYYTLLERSDYFNFGVFSFKGKTMTAVDGTGSIELTEANISKITNINFWVQTTGYSMILLDDIEYTVAGNADPTISSTTGKPTEPTSEETWLTMIDWEKDSEGNDPTITNLVVLGGNKSIGLKTLEAYKVTGTNATNPYKEDSKQGLSIYNDKTNPVCNPTAKSEPTSVSLDADKMKNAKDLRVSMHIKEKVNYTEQFNIGVTVDGKVYYTALERSDYFNFGVYSFKGKTFTAVEGTDSIEITAENISQITNIDFWVQTTGYSMIWLDDIEYFGKADSTEPTEPTTDSSEVTDPQNYKFEAEDVYLTDNGGNGLITTKDYSDYNCGGNIFVRLDALKESKVGNYMEFKLPNIRASKYEISMIHRSGKNNRSKYSISVNGVDSGNVIDFSYSTVDYIKTSGGTINVPKTGDVTIRLTCVEAGSTGFFIDKIVLTDPNAKEASAIDKLKENMNLTWSDEFDGDSLNMDNWYYEHRDAPRNGQYHWYNDSETDNDNVRVKDGKLVITAKKEHHVDEKNNQTYEYTSGGIRTQDQINDKIKKTFKYGIMEARIKMPETSKDALWASFWMCGVNSETAHASWPYTGEIDIIEYLTKTPKTQFSGLHYNGKYTSPADDPGGYSAKTTSIPSKYYTFTDGGAFNSDYHTVGMIWTESYICYYIDDDIFATVDITDKQYEAFRKYDFFFMLTMPVGGTMVKNFDDSDLANPTSEATNSMYVDYVRVYQSFTPIAEKISSTGIKLVERDGYEYSIDGKNWQTSGEFSGLKEGTEYTVYQRVAKTDNTVATDIAQGLFKTKTGDEVETGSIIPSSTTKPTTTAKPTTAPTTSTTKPTTATAKPTDKPTTETSTSPIPAANYGDTDNDGKINMKDVLLLRKSIAGWKVDINLTNADCNADGSINMKDVLLLRKYIAGWNVKLGK